MNTNGSSGLQLSFVTMTVFGTGAPPTVTVTPLAQFITQLVTVTVNNAAAAPSSIAPGISPPPGMAGTGGSGAVGSKTAGIVKTSNAAAGNVRKFMFIFIKRRIFMFED